MTLRTRIYFARQLFFEKVETYIQSIAESYGFPDNPGMPIVPTAEYFWNQSRYSDDFPLRRSGLPVPQYPSNFFQTIFGDLPKVVEIPRLYYENDSDGFYSFYIPNYKNIIFLPNFVSEFLQVKCHLCLDITSLEVARDVLFAASIAYLHVITLRFYMSWVLTINPYTLPWVGVTALVDWVDDMSLGTVPPIFGFNPGSLLLSLGVGKVVDSISQIVFTMPFLPSEGESIKVLLGGQITNVMRFRYLPLLWYKYPIPNEVREFWYTQRPEILNYMQKAYQNLPIQFLPDRIINEELVSHNSINFDCLGTLIAQFLAFMDINVYN